MRSVLQSHGTESILYQFFPNPAVTLLPILLAWLISQMSMDCSIIIVFARIQKTRWALHEFLLYYE